MYPLEKRLCSKLGFAMRLCLKYLLEMTLG
jgi:hypothetical protein